MNKAQAIDAVLLPNKSLGQKPQMAWHKLLNKLFWNIAKLTRGLCAAIYSNTYGSNTFIDT